jgi:hypothetical protein
MWSFELKNSSPEGAMIARRVAKRFIDHRTATNCGPGFAGGLGHPILRNLNASGRTAAINLVLSIRE